MKIQPRLQFILLTACLDSFGLGFIIPNLPDVIRRFETDADKINIYYGLFIASYAFFQFFASPLLGALSDKFGRRPVLLVSVAFAAVDYLFMAYAPNLALLFIGRAISGMTGASIAVANSYISDISAPEERADYFGKLGASWGLGFIIAPAVGGVLGGHFGHTAPFLAAAGFSVLNFLFGFFILPESLPPEKRRAIDISDFHPLKSMRKSFRLAPLLITVYALYFIAGQVYPSIWTLFTQYKFGWSSVQVGISLALFGVLMIAMQGFMTGRITAKLGERGSVIFGLAIATMGFGLFSIAGQAWMMYAISAFNTLSFITGSALQAIISKEAPTEEQGELQGGLASVGALTEVVGPIFYTSLFSLFTGASAPFVFVGVPFFVAGLICAGGLALMLLCRRHAEPAAQTS